MKKLLTLLTAAILLLTIILPAGAAAISPQPIPAIPEISDAENISLPAADITPEKAAQAAKFYIEIVNAQPSGDGNDRTYTYNAVAQLSEPLEFYDISGNVVAYHFTFTVSGSDENNGYIVISAHSDLPLIAEFSYSNSPYTVGSGDTVFYINQYTYFRKTEAGIYYNRYNQSCPKATVIMEFEHFANVRQYNTVNDMSYILKIEDANKALLEAAERVSAEPSFKQRIMTFFDSVIEFFRSILQYSLFRVYFSPDEPETAPDIIEGKVLSFAGKNGCFLTESHFIDTKNLVPQRQSYFTGDYNIGNGICGAASWMMLLAYYRDGLGYTKIPEDEQMFNELLVIFDEITDKMSPISKLAQDICDIINDKTDYFLNAPENSYEVIYALDAGIAQYLYELGYKDLAFNCVRNLNFSIPVLTEAANVLLLKDVRSEIAEWLYKQTNGKLNIISNLRQSAKSVTERSLKRSEPVVIGNWLSFTDDSYTNHYFLATGYCKLKYEYKYNGTVIYTAEKTLIEIFDTWGNSHVSYIDWDILRATCLYDVNSLAAIG